MSTFNVSMKINRAITATTTVTTGAYAVVDYAYQAGDSFNVGDFIPVMPVTRHFGQGQVVPATITVAVRSGSVIVGSFTYGITGGYEIINTL